MDIAKGKCNKCGMCCRAIVIRQSPEEIKQMHSCGDGKFIYENWVSITKEEALKINPYLENWVLHYEGTPFFYSCGLISSDGKCSIHGSQPDVCTGFPWYGFNPSRNSLLYTEDCGYAIDLQRSMLIHALKEWNFTYRYIKLDACKQEAV